MLRILFAVLLASAIHTSAIAQQVLDFAEVEEFTVAIWDETIENVRGTAAGMQAHDLELKDARGRTRRDDVQELILRESVTKHLESLREEARAKASDPAALQRILDAARPIVELEVFKLMLTTSYWLALETLDHHEKLLSPWLARAGAADRDAVVSRITSAREKLLSLREQALEQTSTAARLQVFGQLDAEKDGTADFLNDRRAALLAQQGRKLEKFRERTSPCPPALAPLPGKGAPSFSQDLVKVQTFYPDAMRRMQVEGTVVLRAQLSETGCMKRVDVVESSGVSSLDEAAMQWMERSSFHPASKNGQAVAGTLRVIVKFEAEE